MSDTRDAITIRDYERRQLAELLPDVIDVYAEYDDDKMRAKRETFEELWHEFADEIDGDGEMMLVDDSQSCDNCSKRDVCAIYGNVALQVTEEIPARTGGDPAFDPTDLAIICEMYDPIDGE